VEEDLVSVSSHKHVGGKTNSGGRMREKFRRQKSGGSKKDRVRGASGKGAYVDGEGTQGKIRHGDGLQKNLVPGIIRTGPEEKKN